jgi:cation diffusion facilitator family transporter
MHANSLYHLTHSHAFLGEQHEENERRTWLVVGLTFFMMVAEIAGGTLFGSLALVADGWHMSTHAAALAISAAAYHYARRHVTNPNFAFGTGKLGDLAGYTSAAVLGMIALLIAYQSIERLLHPIAIAYGEAIAIASLGLAVNMTCAWLLRGAHHRHHHDHDHGDSEDNHDHHGQAHDLNLRSAYIHVLADAAASVLAITGLSLAWAFGWRFIDPLVGLAGTAVIGSWAWGLLRAAGRVLVDAVPEATPVETAVRDRLERDGDRVTDFHLWQIGPGHLACIVALVSDSPRSPSLYKARLTGISGLSHVTVEVELCPGQHPHLRRAA